jgi:hypothetical protein
MYRMSMQACVGAVPRCVLNKQTFLPSSAFASVIGTCSIGIDEGAAAALHLRGIPSTTRKHAATTRAERARAEIDPPARTIDVRLDNARNLLDAFIRARRQRGIRASGSG